MLHQSDIYSKISMNHFDISTFWSIKNSSNDKPLMTVCVRVCLTHTSKMRDDSSLPMIYSLALIFHFFFRIREKKNSVNFSHNVLNPQFYTKFCHYITFLLMYDMPNLRRLSLEKMTDPYDALLCNLVIAIQLLTWRHSANIIP